jgi:chromosomal replication initiation ATPase DnaA
MGVEGILRSNWRMGRHLKGDERILGDSDFVESILKPEEEQLERRYGFKARGYDSEKVQSRVAEVCEVEARDVLLAGKQRDRVRARSLLCYWAVRELGMSCTGVSRRLGMTQPAVSRGV